MPPTAAADVEGTPPLEANRGRSTLLFITGLTLGLSASPALRFEVSGLLFQPIVIPVLALYLMGSTTVFARIPRLLRSTLVLFVGFYLVTVIIGGFALGDSFKILMFFLVIVGVGGSIENADDARAAALGGAISMAVVGVVALASGGTGEEAGINPLAGVANVNAYSVYALPMILVAGYFLLENDTPFRSRVVFGVSAATGVVATLTTPNRSGFLGLAVIVVLLLARGRRMRDVFVLVLLASTLYFGFLAFGDTSALDAEFERQSRGDGQSGSELRRTLIEESISIGLSNPVFGVGVQNVPAELGWILYAEGIIRFPLIDAHNVIADVTAGGGITLLVCFVVLGYAAWTRPKEWAALGPPSPLERSARGLLRITIVLFLVRGTFSGDVLTTPGFPFALALALGWTIANRPRRVSDAEADEPAQGRPVRPMRGFGTSPDSRFDHPRRMISFDPWSAGAPPPGRSR